VESWGDNLQLIGLVAQAEIRDGQVSIDRKRGRMVFETAIWRPFVAQEAVGEDGETIVLATHYGRGIGNGFDREILALHVAERLPEREENKSSALFMYSSTLNDALRNVEGVRR